MYSAIYGTIPLYRSAYYNLFSTYYAAIVTCLVRTIGVSKGFVLHLLMLCAHCVYTNKGETEGREIII